MTERPALDAGMDFREFERWYWTMAELQPFARSLGVRAAGPKAQLTRRIAAKLGGLVAPIEPERAEVAGAIGLPLTASTRIPKGQRSTNELRTFFEQQIGPGFTFNGHMRSFLLRGEATLGAAVEHWHSTIGTPLPTQSASLEFNQFTKAWHRANPQGNPSECRAAWEIHRSLPADER